MSYRVRFHPAVADDLDAILRWIIDFAGPQVGARRRAEIEAAMPTCRRRRIRAAFATRSHPACARFPPGGRRSSPSRWMMRRAKVIIHALSYAGADWMARSRPRSR
uniref:Type II toxin-antitoxin system RelE/ParE family toxin n=1 Tax=Cereibacter sphaeroides (strain ATCC 17025 / ATH 2.4.3) TaxID=349102 RepID=A4X089_CERS5